MSTHVNYDNMYSLLAGVVQNLKTKINAIDLTADQKAKLAIIDKIIKTGNGTNFLSNDGTYKNIPLDQLGPMSDKIGVINSLFNIVTQAEHWDSTGIANIPTARYNFTSIIYNGKIYCIGGYNASGIALNIVEIYDIANNSWTTGTPMPTAREGLTSVIYNNKIYCIGGNTGINLNIVEIYDIANNSWTTGTPMPTARYILTSAIYNNKIYCIGGGNSTGYLNIVEIYDIANNSWTTGTNMPTARQALTSQVYNGKIYCIGGYNASGIALNIVEIYDIANNSWTTGTPMPTARMYLASIIYNGKIYCIGGYDTKYTNKVDIYDIANNSWTTGNPMPTARYALTSVLYNGKIYCIGGSNSSGKLNIVEVLYLPYITYNINPPQSILDKLALLITNGTGNKLLTDNGTYQEYIPSGYRQLNTTEINTLTDYIKNNL